MTSEEEIQKAVKANQQEAIKLFNDVLPQMAGQPIAVGFMFALRLIEHIYNASQQAEKAAMLEDLSTIHTVLSARQNPEKMN